MSDLPRGANGLQIIVHETEPVAKIYMFIDGKHTHWVKFNLFQINELIDTLQRKAKQMEKNKDALT